MKIECSINKIKNALISVDRLTGKNLTLPVLSSILWVATEKTLKLRATNLSIGIEIKIPAKIEKEGIVAIRGDILSSLFSVLSGEGNVSFELVNNNLSVKTKSNTILLKSNPYEDFPTITIIKGYNFLIQLGHTVTVISPTNWASFLSWMPGNKNVVDFELYREKATSILNDVDVLFCLDFNIMHRTKNMEQVLLQLNCTKVLIDHHQQPQEEAFNFGASDTKKSSTCEMVYDFIVASGHSALINPAVA